MPRRPVLLSLFLAGCGSAYIAPSVDPVSRSAESPVNVVVVDMTPQIVATANASPYRPRQLPAAFSGATGIPARGDDEMLPDAPAGTEEPVALVLKAPPASSSGPYEIGVADVLLLATKAPATSAEALTGILAAESRRQGYTVQDDGTIAIPDVGRVRVAGMTVEEAEAEVFKALVAAQIEPTFSLEISEFNSKRASIGGAVAAPRLVPITIKPVSLAEALQLSGGISAADVDHASIRLFRDGTLYQIPLTDFYASARYQNITLLDGDAVFVDTEYDLARAKSYFQDQITLYQAKTTASRDAIASLQTQFTMLQAQREEVRSNFAAQAEFEALDRDYVYRVGEVLEQGRIPLPFGRTASLADAIYANKGFRTVTGNPAHIYLLRGMGGGDSVRAYHLDARNPGNLIMATTMQLRPNDFIFIEEQPITKWNRVLSQLAPNLFVRDATSFADAY